MYGIEHRGETGCGRSWTVADPLRVIERSAVKRPGAKEPTQPAPEPKSQEVTRTSAIYNPLMRALKDVANRLGRWF